jgi:hypothetical protein
LKKLEAGWPTAVISFSFLDCPLCNERLSHPLLAPHLKPFLELEEYLTKMAVEVPTARAYAVHCTYTHTLVATRE